MTAHTKGKIKCRCYAGGGFVLESESGFYMADLPINFNENEETQYANASRLALCWNTHDQLLEALELIANTDPLDAALDPQRAVRVARAAIKAAKGEA